MSSQVIVTTAQLKSLWRREGVASNFALERVIVGDQTRTLETVAQAAVDLCNAQGLASLTTSQGFLMDLVRSKTLGLSLSKGSLGSDSESPIAKAAEALKAILFSKPLMLGEFVRRALAGELRHEAGTAKRTRKLAALSELTNGPNLTSSEVVDLPRPPKKARTAKATGKQGKENNQPTCTKNQQPGVSKENEQGPGSSDPKDDQSAQVGAEAKEAKHSSRLDKLQDNHSSGDEGPCGFQDPAQQAVEANEQGDHDGNGSHHEHPLACDDEEDCEPSPGAGRVGDQSDDLASDSDSEVMEPLQIMVDSQRQTLWLPVGRSLLECSASNLGGVHYFLDGKTTLISVRLRGPAVNIDASDQDSTAIVLKDCLYKTSGDSNRRRGLLKDLEELCKAVGAAFSAAEVAEGPEGEVDPIVEAPRSGFKSTSSEVNRMKRSRKGKLRGGTLNWGQCPNCGFQHRAAKRLCTPGCGADMRDSRAKLRKADIDKKISEADCEAFETSAAMKGLKRYITKRLRIASGGSMEVAVLAAKHHKKGPPSFFHYSGGDAAEQFVKLPEIEDLFQKVVIAVKESEEVAKRVREEQRQFEGEEGMGRWLGQIHPDLALLAPNFVNDGFDIEALRLAEEKDLIRLGVTKRGHRLKLQAAAKAFGSLSKGNV